MSISIHLSTITLLHAWGPTHQPTWTLPPPSHVHAYMYVYQCMLDPFQHMYVTGGGRYCEHVRQRGACHPNLHNHSMETGSRIHSVSLSHHLSTSPSMDSLSDMGQEISILARDMHRDTTKLAAQDLQHLRSPSWWTPNKTDLPCTLPVGMWSNPQGWSKGTGWEVYIPVLHCTVQEGYWLRYGCKHCHVQDHLVWTKPLDCHHQQAVLYRSYLHVYVYISISIITCPVITHTHWQDPS
jgi:hypothetical protein